MMGETSADVAGQKMRIVLATPATPGPYRTVLLTHHRDGIDEFTRSFAERLADEGFLVAMPDFYHRRPADEDRHVSRKHLNDGEIVADIDAAVAHLRSMPAVRADAIAIAGHCMGGRLAYLGATSNPHLKAAVVFYGGSILVAEGAGRQPPLALSRNIKCPVAGFFGKEDKNPSPADVEAIAAELRRHGIRHEFRFYDGAGHAFQNHTNERAYRKEAAEDAWVRMLAFLRQEL